MRGLDPAVEPLLTRTPAAEGVCVGGGWGGSWGGEGGRDCFLVACTGSWFGKSKVWKSSLDLDF